MKFIRTENGIEKMTEAEYEEYLASQKTEDQVKAEKIVKLKQQLAETDYQALKASEGVPSDDWETIKAEREALREAIRELEK